MKKTALFVVLLCFQFSFSQKRLVSWSQQNIENYTEDMYNEAQKLSPEQLLEKNKNAAYWSEVFLTMNASVNNYENDKEYLKNLARQITDTKETKIKGTSRLIIWDRIVSGDIIFEGKGLVVENDLFLINGRANQVLQSVTRKNFGFVTSSSTEKELESLREKWLDYLNGKPVEEFKPTEFKNAKIAEINGLNAVHALIISLQDNSVKEQITKKCLKQIYNLDEFPTAKESPAKFCSPDTYTYAYLAMLFGDKTRDETKTAKWWLNFWNENQKKLTWNDAGFYEVKK